MVKDLLQRIERGLIRFVVLAVVMMVLVQGFMSVDPIRFYLSWGERMEGEKIQLPVAANRTVTADPDMEQTISPQARLVIETSHFSSLPRARILVNGAERSAFNGKRVSLAVQAGDTVEIDATAYDFPVEFRVTAVSSNLVFPDRSQSYTANRTMVMVGKVVVK